MPPKTDENYRHIVRPTVISKFDPRLCEPHVAVENYLASLSIYSRNYWLAGHAVFQCLPSKRQRAFAERLLTSELLRIKGVSIPANIRTPVCKRLIIQLLRIQRKLLYASNRAQINNIIVWLTLYYQGEHPDQLYPPPRPNHELVVELLEHYAETEPQAWLIGDETVGELFPKIEQPLLGLLNAMVAKELKRRVLNVAIPELVRDEVCHSMFGALPIIQHYAGPENSAQFEAIKIWLRKYHEDILDFELESP